MARTKGQATKRRINLAARALAVDKGFTGASQREIAERAGVEKPLVQYHFPEKRDFVISFIDDLLDLQSDFARQSGWTGRGYFEDLIVVGHMHFAYLLEGPKMGKITPDLVGTRSNTEALIDREAAWSEAYRGPMSEAERVRWDDIVAMTMGGAYELVYRCSSGNSHVDPKALIESSIRMHMTFLGDSPETIETLISGYDDTRYNKAALFAFLDKNLFDPDPAE